VVAGLADLPGHPAAQNKRVAYKDPVKDVEMQNTRDLLDPRVFFGDGGSTKWWDDIGHLKEEAGRIGDALKVSEAEGPGGRWYRISVFMVGGWLATLTCSPEAGFNPVRRVVSLDHAGEKMLKDVQWQWKRFGEIYLPAEVTTVQYDRQTGTPTNSLRVRLGKCIVNKPVDPDQFTYKALGLKDGDLVMDRVDRQFLIHENGKLVKLADFGKRYAPPASPSTPAMSTTRWVLVAFSIICLAIAVTALAIKRSRSRTG
jgi:hypothetical protein